MTYNYHTHTHRCHHASGTEEEYILRAIEGGITHMGFSDHIPMKFPDGFESGHRIPTDLAADYFSTLSALREKFKGKIDIKIGFEMEYYPLYFEEMLQNAINWGCEYLILGQHYLYNERPESITASMPASEKDLDEYVSCVLRGMESGVFTYVAHPDIINFPGSADIYDKFMRKICIVSREKNIPLEINFLGIRDNRRYPNDAFWKIAAEEKSPVTFGFDAHTAPSSYDGDSIPKAEALVKKFGLNYIGKPGLILIQELYK